jgi:hypothetical protein
MVFYVLTPQFTLVLGECRLAFCWLPTVLGGEVSGWEAWEPLHLRESTIVTVGLKLGCLEGLKGFI